MTNPPSQEMLAMAQQVLESQSFSVHMGMQVESAERGKLSLRLPIRDEFLQHHRFVHGGVTSFLADCALAFVGATTLGPNVVTSNFRIDYVAPAQGEYLLARSSVLSSGKRQAVCRAEVYALQGGQEKLVALAQGTIVSLG